MLKKILLAIIIVFVSLVLVAALFAVMSIGVLIESKNFRASVNGRITDAGGSPIANAKVSLYIGGSDGSENRFECTTDGNGYYLMQTQTLHYALDSSAAYRAMSIVAEGYIPVSVEKRIARGSNSNWNFQLTESVTASGRLTNAKGEPMADCTLYFMPVGQTNAGSDLRYKSESTKTDTDGRFSLKSVGPFEYRVLRDEYGTRMYRQTPVNGDVVDLTDAANRQGLDIRMNDPLDYAIAGYVKDSDGNPVKGAFVWTLGENSGISGTWGDTTNAQGAFCIIGLDGIGKDSVDLNVKGKTAQQQPFRMQIPNVSLRTDNLSISAQIETQ